MKKDYIKNTKIKIGKIDLLITEGTSLSRNVLEYDTEKEMENKISKYMNEYEQIFIMRSSTNIDRTATLVKSVLKSGKNYILDLLLTC